MSELSQHAKLIKAIEIAKGAQVGIELSYFDVLEVAGELNEAKEVVAMLTARIAELEHDLTNKEIEYTDLWNDALAFQSRVAELEAESERFTVHSDIERQDDKSPNDTQTQTIVYGKWIPVSERLPEVYRDGDGEFIPFLVCENDKDYPYRAIYDGLNWGDGMFVADVTHWMPLPEPPIVYGKECIDQLTAHDATERQDDKSPNDTQKDTVVYGKDSKQITWRGAA